MSYRDAMATLVEVITAVTPTFDADYPFVFDENEDGYVRPLEELAGFRHRACDFRTTSYSTDDGEAGFTTKRFRTGLELRVLYKAMQDRAWLDRVLGEDIALLVNALINPNNYNAAVVSIPPPGSPSVEEILTNEPNPKAAGWILSIPFDLIYLSEGP